VKRMRSKGAGGPVSDTSYNGNRRGWTQADSPRPGWCTPGRRKMRQHAGVESIMPLDRLPLCVLLIFFWPTIYTSASHEMAVLVDLWTSMASSSLCSIRSSRQ